MYPVPVPVKVISVGSGADRQIGRKNGADNTTYSTSISLQLMFLATEL